MSRPLPLCWACLGLTCLLAPPALRADLRLRLQVRLSTELSPGFGSAQAKPPPGPRTYEETLTVGSAYLADEQADTVVIDDFAARQIRFYSKKSRTWSATSLYSDIGFREAEMQNRLALAHAFAAAKVPAANPGQIEQLFALATGQPSAVVATEDPGERRFAAEGRPLFAEDRAGLALQPEEVVLVQRAFRYRLPLQPKILASLSAPPTLPQHFEIWRNNFQIEHAEVTVLGLDRLPPGPPPLPPGDFVRRDTANAGLQPLLARAAAIDAEKFAADCRLLKAGAAEDALGGKAFPSFVEFIAYTLASGQPLPAEFGTFKSQFQADPAITRLEHALHPPHDKGDAEDKVRRLHALGTEFPAQAPLLGIFEANYLVPLGKPAEATKAFEAALAFDPCLVGVWKDLGDLFYKSYQMSEAWLCWDAARRLSPEHSMLRPIDDLEAHLRSAHPEFF